MPTITSISFSTITLFKKAKHVGWFSSPEGFFLSASLFPKNSIVESWTVANPLLLLIVFHSTLVSSRALTFFCCPLCAISNVSFSIALRLALGCSSVRGGLFKFSFMRRKMLPHDLSASGVGPPFVQSGAVSRFILLNSILNVQRQQWLQLL